MPLSMQEVLLEMDKTHLENRLRMFDMLLLGDDSVFCSHRQCTATSQPLATYCHLADDVNCTTAAGNVLLADDFPTRSRWQRTATSQTT
eukprot:6416178-Karenia_brevis.AAC.1